MNKLAEFSILLLAALLLCSGCAPKKIPEPVVYQAQPLQPGEANYVWGEPIVDVIDVPPGLDPDGVYYRPGHKEVVEIRQGRWQYEKGAENDSK